MTEHPRATQGHHGIARAEQLRNRSLRFTSIFDESGLLPDQFPHDSKRPLPEAIEDQSHRPIGTAQPTGRTLLARELHVEIGQYLSAIHADAAAIRNRGDAFVRKSAEAIIKVTGQMRELVGGIPQRPRAAVLEDWALTRSLRELVRSFQQRNPDIVCSLSTSGALRDIDSEVGAALCRVVQECLTNTAHHAKAHFVVVEVALFSADPGVSVPVGTSLPPAMLRVTVSDDGIGFRVRAATQGFGLSGIRERITALGGIYDIDAQPGRGTSISVEVPLPATLRPA